MRLGCTSDTVCTGDVWFHHRKLHRLLALAGYTAVRFRSVRVRVGFGTASRRDRLAYLCFEDAELVYGPADLMTRAVTRVEVPAPPHALRLHVAAPAADVARVERELVRAVNDELQRAYQRKADPGPLYNGVYVVSCTAAPAAATGTTVVLACRRTEDHRAAFFAVRRFAAHRLRGAAVTYPREQAEPVEWCYGSWLLVSPAAGPGTVLPGGGLAFAAAHAELQHARHPCLRGMYCVAP